MKDKKKQKIVKSPEYFIELVIHKRWIILVSLFFAMIAGIVNAIITPRTFRAETVVFVEPKKVSDAYVKTIDNVDTKSRINTISEQIKSRTNLERIMQQHKLYSGPEYRNMYPEDKLSSLRRRIDIKLKSSRGSDSFTISFKDQSPEIARDVTNSISTTFINESIRLREIEAFDTTTFIEERLKATEDKLLEIERSMTNYKTRYMGELPEQLQTNLNHLNRLQGQMVEKQTGLRDARNRLVQLGNRLAIENLVVASAPVSTTIRSSSSPSIPTDIQQLQVMLADYLIRYSEFHPDVVRLKKMLEALERKKENAVQQTDEPVSDEKPEEYRYSNPILEIQREETLLEIKILEEDIEQLKRQILEYERRVEATPKREAELLSLQRDYEETKRSYASLKTRHLEAEIASDLIVKQKGESFRIIDRAKLPQRPESPNVLKILMFFMAAGLGIGGGIVFLLDFLDQSFRKVEHAELFLDLPIIATIPLILTRRQLFWKRVNYALSFCLLMLNGVLLLFFVALAFKGVDQTINKLKAVSRILQGFIS